ncbi:flagellar assembly protein FliX [Labrys wisconsinensis]|uniref:Flagellar assembly protein FliX n=1 Tax=Labrys wisconsinensis TaxID=425677 RepID=A0ABU0JFM1_9HYPH|nr:flagellar assembly protein FliX [Labrys wisconsinensis]MDQ0473075.1 hypothetical protein [Labrys wisconsinensis]
MHIDGAGRVRDQRPLGAAARPSGAGAAFSLGVTQGGAEPAAARSAPALAGLDAMLALQAVEDPLARRRKALRRGRRLLDLLDGLKVAMLDGAVSAADIGHLAALLHDSREGVDDPGLESVLAEIDVRAAVELAKLDRART